MQSIINSLRDLAKANPTRYPTAELSTLTVAAIRGLNDANLSVGNMLQVSYEWIDNNQTNNKLPGTCACKIIDIQDIDDYSDDELLVLVDKAIKQAKSYGDRLVLVYGLKANAVCNDDFANEVIIEDCTIGAIIND